MTMLNRNVIKGRWTELKGKIKQQWGNLTDDDLTRLEGTYEELRGLLQRKYGYQEEEAKKELDSFIEKEKLCESWNERGSPSH